MAPFRQSQRVRKAIPQGRRSRNVPPLRDFAIPFFAHQQLDQDRYGQVLALTLPVGRPGWVPAPLEITAATNTGCEDHTFDPLDADYDEEVATPETFAANINSTGAAFQERNNPYKRLRVVSGRPAVAKKVTADLDSDDELIVRMKNAKYLEKDIAQRLADEGRTAYHPKTIGTRWARIRRALAVRNDELLDADMTDWHDGDDDALYQAYQRAQEIIEKAKAEADSRMWRVVADQLKTIKPVTNFSQNACRSRYEALQSGTAKPTPESIVEPDESILERIQARQEKEARIQADANRLGTPSALVQNVEGNSWTSKSRRWA